jgi:hypothetical protein
MGLATILTALSLTALSAPVKDPAKLSLREDVEVVPLESMWREQPSLNQRCGDEPDHSRVRRAACGPARCVARTFTQGAVSPRYGGISLLGETQERAGASAIRVWRSTPSEIPGELGEG